MHTEQAEGVLPFASDDDGGGLQARCASSRKVWVVGSLGKSRAAVLSQAGAPLSWTNERADTLFVCE